MPSDPQQTGDVPIRTGEKAMQTSRVHATVVVTTEEMDGTHVVAETGDSRLDAMDRCRVSAARADAIGSGDIRDVQITEVSFERVFA